MNYTQRPYRGEVDLTAMLALKQLCTTPQNVYDRPTTGEMRRLFTPFIELAASANDQQSWREALRGMSSENRHRALTQRLTALWEDANGQLAACALIAQPGCSLTFYVHPQEQGQGIEAKVLAWGLEQTRLIAQARGASRDLWCRCHEGEQEHRSVL
jgi:GNAT superfamily N-acetyltransferase